MKKLLGVIVLLSSMSLSFCGGEMGTKANDISETQMNFVLEKIQKKLDGMNGEGLKAMQSLLQNTRCELKNLSEEQRKQNAGRIQSLKTFIPVVGMLIAQRQRMINVDQAKKL